jgi:hypothetical protein
MGEGANVDSTTGAEAGLIPTATFAPDQIEAIAEWKKKTFDFREGLS